MFKPGTCNSNEQEFYTEKKKKKKKGEAIIKEKTRRPRCGSVG